MQSFQPISANTPIQEVIQAAFDTTMDVAGAWGYTQEEATVLTANPQKLPLAQLEHMLASMRAYLEMNMTLPEEARYGSINVNEKSREKIEQNGTILHHVIYEITGMKESEYAAFIEEYKAGYGKEGFDMAEHFQRRKEATLVRTVSHWFDVTQIV